MTPPRSPRACRSTGNRVAAFTLVELLVVIAIVAVLAALLTPSLGRAHKLARSAVCCHNLHEISLAFNAAAGQEGAAGRHYPEADAWPGIPMNAVPEPGIYLCPEGPAEEAGGAEYQLYVKNPGAYINFDENFYCRVEDHGDFTRYKFEVYTAHDWNDAIFDVTKDLPRVATFSYDSHISPGVALRRGGEDVAGWEELSAAQFGQSVTFGGGQTNYGMNARAGGFAVRTGMLVVLDYDRLTANRNEDLGVHLRTAARHLGRLNALTADGAARSFGPSELDPSINAAAAALWSP